MVVGVPNGLALHRIGTSHWDGGNSRYTHYGICEATARCTSARARAVGAGWIGYQHRNRLDGFYRHAPLLYLRPGFLAQDAGPVAARIECGGVLLDGHFR